MAFWKWWHSEPAAPPREIPADQHIEEVIAEAHAADVKRAFCYVIAAGDCPVTWTPYYSTARSSPDDEDDVKVFTDPGTASAYKAYGQAVVALRDASDLWACLNNPRRANAGNGTNRFPPPYGMTMNQHPHAAGYVRYGRAHLQERGLDGLRRGFDSAGELKGATPERVRYRACLLCGKPSFLGDSFHCISCGYSGEVHPACRSGGGSFSGTPFTIGGRAVRCPQCGATG